MSRFWLWLGLGWLLMTGIPAVAGERLTWNLSTTDTEGHALTPAEQKAVRYRVYLGESPTTLVPMVPDVTKPPVLLTSVPQLTLGHYVGVTAVLDGVESSAMSELIRYAAPGEVLGLAIESIPSNGMVLSWRPVFRYADDTVMTPADQAAVRYHIDVGDDRTSTTLVVADLETSWVAFERIHPLTLGQFLSVTASIGTREGPRTTAIRWQGQSTIGPARQSIQAPP